LKNGLKKIRGMKVIKTVRELRDEINLLNISPLAFVPTMGALHEGHLSLVDNARSQCPLVVVSIFVNPTQFNDREDLKNYPRTPEKDLSLLDKVLRLSDIVFMPGVKEVYPEEDTRQFNFGNLEKVMEALHRPGHFNGVGQVVSRLFDIVKPDVAIFGQKDFQQLAVIKELVRQTGSKISIIGSPIIRESDGLAMSSRNTLLDPVIRRNASIIFTTITAASRMIKEKEIAEIKSFVTENIDTIPGFEVEYFEIADDTELIPVTSAGQLKKGKKYFGCIAVRAGKIRLIDNIEIGIA
jgi:pantoate--beta-alanine ligase